MTSLPIRDECYMRGLLLRDSKMLTQKWLAAKIKISPQYLNDIIGGNRAVPDVVANYYGFKRLYGFVQTRIVEGITLTEVPEGVE